jgi:hypothetical protein
VPLDLKACALTFSGEDDLSEEEQEALDLLFDTIEEELNAFIKEFEAELEADEIDVESIQSHREENTLTIKMPSPKYYDAFVQQLMDKNLLPTPLNQEKTKNNAMAEKHQVPAQEDQKEQEATSTASNPFNIKNGPSIK